MFGETEQDTAELYATLEALFSDVWLLERGKTTLADMNRGSAQRALHVLRKLNKYRLDQSLPIFLSDE